MNVTRSLAALLLLMGLLSCSPLWAEEGATTQAQDTSILDIRVGKTNYNWAWLAGRFDADQDGVVKQEDIPLSPSDFSKLDRTWDQRLTSEDFDWSAEGRLCRQKEIAFALFKSADKSSDGRLSEDEFKSVFQKLAGDKGYLNEEELERVIFLPQLQKSRAEAKNRHLHVEFLKDDEGQLPLNLPGPGEQAPDFDLRTPDGLERMKLSSFRGRLPVVLVFGCLSCGNYRTYSETLERMYRSRKEEVLFLRVYVREAHPIDDRAPSSTNRDAGILIRQPVTLDERCDVASRCATQLDLEAPMVVDGIDNAVGKAYGGWPDRLYIVDIDGNIAYQGGPGPFAFNPREMEQTLILMLLDQKTK